MRARRALAASLLFAVAAVPAFAEEPSAGPFGTAVPTETLDHMRGGTDSGSTISDAALLTNGTTQVGANSGNISVSNDAAKLNGFISSLSLSGNQGLTTVMQNTGDLVNLTNATSINIYMH